MMNDEEKLQLGRDIYDASYAGATRMREERAKNDELRAELAALRKLGLDVADIIPQLESSAEAGASIHYTVLGGWARRLSEALEAWEASKR